MAMVYVAIRFVNELDLDFEFPEDIELSLRVIHDVRNICDQLKDCLKRWKMDNSMAPKRLFDEDFNDTWKWELWALPQGDGWDKLYKYENGTLAQFLHPETTDSEDDEYLRLYIEAHVISAED